MEIIQVLTFIIGGPVVSRTLFSVIQPFVLPRAANDFIVSRILRLTRSFIYFRFQLFTGLERFADTRHTWGVCFADFGESHTSLVAMSFFRSPQPEHS